MEDYSFLNHVKSRLGEFLTQHGFSLNILSSQVFPGFENNLLLFDSRQCQIRISVEHHRIDIDISAPDVKDPNLWYNIDVMACFVSDAQPNQWIYNLPRGVPLRQVMEQQLTRWQAIVENHFDKIMPMFVSKDNLYEMRKTLDEFVQSFYAERQRASMEKTNLAQNKSA